MSNMKFDQIYKTVEVQEAQRTLAELEAARSNTVGLTVAEKEFLDRAISATKVRIATAKTLLRQWWT